MLYYKVMRRDLLTILFIPMLSILNVQAAEIVYPSSQNVKINSPITAFIGNEKKHNNLTINGEKVNIHPSGGFKHPVCLKYGENIFTISNGEEVKTYKITRNYTNNTNYDPPQTIYETPIAIITKNDNVPLRSTPVDAGLNRLQHLSQGIQLKAIGEYKDFYKVQLSRDDYAWISKVNTEVCLDKINEESLLISSDHKIDSKEETFTFKLSSKLPYVLSENNTGYDLVIYGLNEELYPFGRYELHIPANKKLGYSAKYNADDELVIKIKNFTNNIKDLTITLDPGHGGSERGTAGCLGDKEKDFNLKVAQMLESKLKALGANVIMTRNSDKFVSLQDRVKIANDNNSQIFISIHANALPDTLLDKNITGTEIYYFYPQAKELSQIILNSINEKTGNTNGKIKAESFAVVRNTEAISILIEAGYMIDPEENSKLITQSYQDKITDGIIKGIERFLNGI